GVRAQDQDKPWFVYFSTGCSHAPHHVPAEWADKYRGRFDPGWDRLREEVFERQKRLGVVPADAELTPRNDAFPAWDSLDEGQKRLYARQMEVYAGYSENADHNVGRGPGPERHRRDGGAGGHPGHLDLGRQRILDGGHPHRLVQRADHAERHPPHPPAAASPRPALR